MDTENRVVNQIDMTGMPVYFPELMALLDTLMGDVGQLVTALREDKTNDSLRRLYVRTLFTLIEGFVYSMKAAVLAERVKREIPLSDAELAILAEVSYELDNKGQTVSRTTFVKVPANLLFAFSVFTRTFGHEYVVSTSDHQWAWFMASLKVRNRITHPKSTADLIVSDEELNQAQRVFIWFITAITQAFIGLAVAYEIQSVHGGHVEPELYNEILARYQKEFAQMTRR